MQRAQPALVGRSERWVKTENAKARSNGSSNGSRSGTNSERASTAGTRVARQTSRIPCTGSQP